MLWRDCEEMIGGVAELGLHTLFRDTRVRFPDSQIRDR